MEVEEVDTELHAETYQPPPTLHEMVQMQIAEGRAGPTTTLEAQQPHASAREKWQREPAGTQGHSVTG